MNVVKRNTLPPILDHHLVAYLSAHNIPYTMQPTIGDNRRGRIEVAFFVEDSPEVNRLIAEFHADASIKRFLASLQEVKDSLTRRMRDLRRPFRFFLGARLALSKSISIFRVPRLSTGRALLW
jgi:hypothetical protein